MLNQIKIIEGFENYAITDTGKVYSFLTNKWLKFSISKGYKRIELQKDGKRHNKRINRLVAQTFIPNPLNLPLVEHEDDDKSNNNLSNLKWSTQKDNMRSAWSNGLMKRRAVPVLCVETGKIYSSLKTAAKAVGLKRSSGISDCISNKRKTAGGYTWKLTK